MNYRETPYGFEYGNIDVSRCMSDDKDGWCALELKTDKNDLVVYVTKTGKVRVIDQITGEWWEPVNSVVAKRRSSK